ncbi:MAG: SHOCT domain-containing protein [Chloroflexi bacterium]|nr:SHOCT domain-containing protein [Chloroflexota bacterium]
MFGPGRRMSRRTARRTSRRVSKRQAAPQQPQAAPPPPAAAAPPPAAAEEDYTDELEKLADLKVKGVITNEEFEAKKKQLLGL